MGSMITRKRKIAVLVALCLFGRAGAVAVVAPRIRAEEAPRATGADSADDKRWQAVAPGLVEPWSGEIKIAAPVIGRISEVLVKPNDKVFAGELLVRLDDDEARARLATAQAQVALRKRVRNDQSASSRAAERRKAEDAAADADKAVVDAQAALDRSAAAKRAGGGSDADLDAARTALSRAQERLKQQKAELRKVESDSGTPLPSQAEGQLNVARAELMVAEAGIERMAVRAPIDGTVLQVNARVGEMATIPAENRSQYLRIHRPQTSLLNLVQAALGAGRTACRLAGGRCRYTEDAHHPKGNSVRYIHLLAP